VADHAARITKQNPVQRLPVISKKRDRGLPFWVIVWLVVWRAVSQLTEISQHALRSYFIQAFLMPAVADDASA
jgi:hypothetical protein